MKKALFCAFALGLLVFSLTMVASAGAATPWWQLDSFSVPANLAPGGTGKLLVSSANLGDGEVNGSGSRVTLRDRLPAGLVATSAFGKAGGIPGTFFGIRGEVECSVVSAGSLVECTWEAMLPPYEQLEATIEVEVQAGAKSGEVNEVSVTGGGAAGAVLKRPITVSSAPTAFGVSNYELAAFNENGSLDTQAGSHPFGLTTTLDLNRTATPPYQPALPKDLRFNLPPGLVGNPTPFPQCSDAQFSDHVGIFNRCPGNTAVGVASVTIYYFFTPLTVSVPVFNLKPSTGEPARFGFLPLDVPVILDTSVRTGGDYGVTVSASNIVQVVAFLGSQVTFWGVPGDPSHDSARGWECISGGIYKMINDEVPACPTPGRSTPPPFLSLPTSCTGALQTTMTGDTWPQMGSFLPPVQPVFEPALDGCNRLPFEPSISVAPDSQAGSTPTGLTVGIHVPQQSSLNPNGLAQANVKDTTVALPAGIALNPSAADGLESCSEGQVGLSSGAAAVCPEASKVGTAEIATPLLPNPLTGAVYLAAQNANPFGSLVALYVVAEDPISGSLIKVAGEVKPDPITGQLVSTFKDTPQLPFEDLKLHFFGGSRAPLGTPALCGPYTTTTSIAPWSGNEPATPSSTFQITSGPSGSACASPAPFHPSLTAGSTDIQAGAFTPFTTTMSREDGQQSLQGVVLHMPPGVSGLLSKVKLCGEPQADEGLCGPESEIGETIVSVGLGANPFSVRGGKVFITEGYAGAPYGLSIVNPAKAGPYDLEKNTPCDCVVVRRSWAGSPWRSST
jgi:hypothetical protein